MKSASKHILIIDDSLDQQTLLKIILEANGYTTECRSNGEEALQLLHSDARLPDAILLDLNMPIMGGLEFRKAQQQDPLLKDIPVVIMSGENDLTSTRKKTNSEVLTKPFTIANLIEIVSRNSYLH